MAAIGSIRKHGILLMCIIGIALLAFVMGDVSKLSTFYSDKYTMVKINGNKLDDEYRAQLEQNTSLWKIFYEKTTLEETETYQIHDMTWNNLLEQTIMDKQLKDLGLSITQEIKEEVAANMIASLNTQQPNQLLQRLISFLAQQAGMEQALAFISNIEEYKNNTDVRDLYNTYKAIERFAIIDFTKARYLALGQNTVSFSDEAAKYFAANNNTMLAQTMTIFPNAAPFDEMQPTVTDKEAKDWFTKHIDRYQIKNTSRDIDLAIFPIQPSPEDLAAIQDTAMNRATRLKEAASVEEYHISMMYGQLDSTWYKRSDINIDTLVKLIFDRPIGAFIEPFEYENAIWYYGKTYGREMRPDSVHLALLVVDYKSDRNPSATRTKNEAKETADSLKNILQRGTNIFALMPDYLGGRNAADTTFWVPEHAAYPQLYNSFLNENIYVQDAQDAYRVFQVLERAVPEEKRQFVIYSEEIKPSDATVKYIRSQAMQLQAESASAEELMENAAKNGIQVMQGKDITAMAASIAQMQGAREIVSWSFNENTKINDVSDVYNLNNNSSFVVAAVRDMKKKGKPQLASVREAIETEIKTVKKIELIEQTIAKELNSGSSMQQISEKYQMSIQDSVTLTFGGETYQNRNIENGAIGKIFTLPLAKPTVVAGKNNLYAVSVYEKNESPEPSANFAMEKSTLKNAVAGRSRAENIILEGLKDKANILDQRYLYFQR